jgi:Pectate lyase superfamily protein
MPRRRLLAGGVQATGLTMLGASAMAALGAAPEFGAEFAGSPAALVAAETDWISVRDYGAVGDGVVDDTAAIQAAVAAAAEGGVVSFGAGRTYRITGPLDLPIGRVGYHGSGVTLDCSAVPDSAGHAIRFIPSPTDIMTYTYRCEGLRILGPASQTRQLDGVIIGRPEGMTSGNVAGCSFHNVVVRGFRDNWTLADQSWLCGFYHCVSSHAWRRGYNVVAVTNAGENYHWHGGVIYDCRNASGTAVGLYTSVEGNSDIHFFGVSFDYNDLHVHVQSGQVTLTGCHLEDASTSLMALVASTGGFEPAKLDLLSCVLSGTETIPGGRGSFVSVSGDRSVLRISGGSWSRYDRANSELVTVPASAGSPLVSVERVDPVIRGNAAPRISGYTSLLHNGGFESGVTGWRLPAGSPATGRNTLDTGTARSGTASLKITNTGTGNYGLYRDVPCQPGQRLFVRGYLLTADMTGGAAGLRLEWLDLADVSVATARTVGESNLTASTGAWTQRANAYAAPAGAAVARIWAWSAALNGAVWFDDIEAWLI